MTSICAMQPYVFPYLPYYQLAHAVDEFWILDDVQFIRRGWMNRNHILLGGRQHLVTFPVDRGQQSDRILEKTLPASFGDSLKRTTATLEHAYGRAPHGAVAVSLLASLAERPWHRFLDFALETLRLSFDHLGLNTALHLSSSLKLPRDLRGLDRILAICARAGADRYVNPVGGRALYDTETFGAQGVTLGFLHGDCRPYPQTDAARFHPGLSILDLIANLDPARRQEHLRNYTVTEPLSKSLLG